MESKDILFISIAVIVLAIISLVFVCIYIKKKEKKIKEENQLAAVIAAAVSVYTETPESNFKVVSFKKVNKFRAWNT